MENNKVIERPEIGLSAGQIWIFLAAVTLAAIIIVFTVFRPVVNFGPFRVEEGLKARSPATATAFRFDIH